MKSLSLFPFLAFLIFFIVPNIPCHGSTPIPCGLWKWKIIGQRSYDGYTNNIYDDFDYPCKACSTCTPLPWNCSSYFLLRDYIGDNISMTIIYDSDDPTYVSSTPPYSTHDVYIYQNYNPTPIAIYINQSDGVASPVVKSFSTKGVYTYVYYKHNATPVAFSDAVNDRGSTDGPDMVAEVVVLPKIQNIWIEAQPICSNNYSGGSGPNYTFQVKTNPSISDIMFPVTPTPASDCDAVTELLTEFDFNQPVYDNSGVAVVPPLGTTSYVQYLGQYWVSPYPDYQDFYMKAADLSTYLPGGSSYSAHPLPMFLGVTYTDGITSMSVNAPVIIEDNANTTICPTCSASCPTCVPPIVAPPGAKGVPSESFQLYDYTVNGTETWTPTNNPMTTMFGTGSTINTLYIQDKVTIPKGSTLNINNMTVVFGPGGSIEVQNDPTGTTVGGYLTINGSTLKAYEGDCGTSYNHTWNGIIIDGSSSVSQYAPTGTVFTLDASQGNVYTYNSTISNATTGIALLSGGILYARNTTFESNGIGIEFSKYHNFDMVTHKSAPNLSHIIGCSFIKDNSILPYFCGIAGFEVEGINVNGCTFNNSIATTAPSGCGITGWDLGLNVYGGQFTNLQSGISETSIIGGATEMVSAATLNNNLYAIDNEGTDVPIIMNNNFSIPTSASITNPYMGMLQKTGSGYTATGNTFTGITTSSGYNEGFLAWNTGSSDNYVNGNNYSYLGVGNEANYINTNANKSMPHGLQFTCNANSNNIYDIATDGNNPVTNGVNPTQGTTTSPAANTFSSTYLGSIYNPLTEVAGPIVYYYGTSGNDVPIGSTTGVTEIATGHQDICPSTVYSPSSHVFRGPAPTPTLALMIHYYMGDSIGITHRDSLYYFAGQINTAYGDLLKTNLFIVDSLIDSANNTYNHIVSKYGLTGTEATEFSVWGRKFMNLCIAVKSAGGNLLSPSAAQIDTLNLIADSAKMWARVRAENWLRLISNDPYSYIYNDMLLYPGAMGGGQRIAQSSSPILGNTQQISNEIYPNPVSDYLKIFYNATSKNEVYIQIVDMYGRQVLTQNIEQNGTTQIDVRNLPSGVYAYKVYEGDSETMNGKVTKY